MKKVLSALLIVGCLSLGACSSKNNDKKNEEADSETTIELTETSGETEETKETEVTEEETSIEQTEISVTTENANEIVDIKDAEVGDIVFFGSYEQDNDTSNGPEDIEWIVLAKEDGKVLVISKYMLDRQPYNAERGFYETTWETCSLRQWMNETFLNSAFSAEEQELILDTNVSADMNPEYDTNPGNPTTDKVFLLSIAELELYFPSQETRICDFTEYAVAVNTPFVDSNTWWLRSPGYDVFRAAYVSDEGWESCYGDLPYYDFIGVRPVLWINLEA